MGKAPSRLYTYADKMRRSMTPKEKLFRKIYASLAAQKGSDWGLKTQRVFDKGKTGYIVDFYVPQLRLAIEIDGQHHKLPDQAKYDADRTKWLNKKNIDVVRFANDEVEDSEIFRKDLLERLFDRKRDFLLNEAKKAFLLRSDGDSHIQKWILARESQLGHYKEDRQKEKDRRTKRRLKRKAKRVAERREAKEQKALRNFKPRPFVPVVIRRHEGIETRVQ